MLGPYTSISLPTNLPRIPTMGENMNMNDQIGPINIVQRISADDPIPAGNGSMYHPLILNEYENSPELKLNDYENSPELNLAEHKGSDVKEEAVNRICNRCNSNEATLGRVSCEPCRIKCRMANKRSRIKKNECTKIIKLKITAVHPVVLKVRRSAGLIR